MNGNLVQDAGEPGIPGVTVELLGTPQNLKVDGILTSLQTPAGLVTLLTTVSNSNGDYAFNYLPAGTFYVRAILPDGSQQDSGPITLAVNGGAMNSGQADFPEGTLTLPYTGR